MLDHPSDARSSFHTATAVLAVAAMLLTAGCETSGTSTSDTDNGLTKAAAVETLKGDAYLVTLGVSSNSGSIGALQFEIAGGAGGFAGGGADVECDSMVDEALAAFSRHEPSRVVGAVIDVAGFTTPTAVARCTYVAESAPDAGSFSLKVTEASDIGANALASVPTMTVSNIQRVE